VVTTQVLLLSHSPLYEPENNDNNNNNNFKKYVAKFKENHQQYITMQHWQGPHEKT